MGTFHCRLTDIKVQKEQFEKWFLEMNSSAVVPVMMYKGKAYMESKDIAQFVIKNISTEHKLLLHGDVIVSILFEFTQLKVKDVSKLPLFDPVQVQKTKPLLLLLISFNDAPYKFQMDGQIRDLVERYNNEVLIEQMSMCAWSLQNKFMGFMIPKHLNNSISSLRAMKTQHPEMTELLDKKIDLLLYRQKLLLSPQANRDEAFERMQDLLDQLESNLSESAYICGPSYTFADCLFTILLARLKMLEVIDKNLEKRPKLAEWWEKVQKRPSYKKAGIIDSSENQFPHWSTILKNVCSVM